MAANPRGTPTSGSFPFLWSRAGISCASGRVQNEGAKKSRTLQKTTTRSFIMSRRKKAVIPMTAARNARISD